MPARTDCRSCQSRALRTFLALGDTPLADALVTPDAVGQPEPRFPLDVAFCPECTLVQVLEEVPPEQLFVDNYLYFSSFSDALVAHGKRHAEGLIAARGLDGDSLVVEIASNDGYLLRQFAQAGIPVLGIDPAPAQADAAQEAGVPTLREFFGVEVARRLRAEGRRADVIIANNVMAHVPDLNGFVAGIATLLADDGVATIENPSVGELLRRRAFDTIYHEHHCYFSCLSVDALMRRHGLVLHDVEYFDDLHAGTLRWHVGHGSTPTARARRALAAEREEGLDTFAHYSDFAEDVAHIDRELNALLTRLRADGARIAAYGAAAKGATLLNVTGIGTDLLDYVVDRNTHKQGRFMPGVGLPIHSPERLTSDRPDYLLLLAWNFADEIMAQQDDYARAGGRFIVPVPEPAIINPSDQDVT